MFDVLEMVQDQDAEHIAVPCLGLAVRRRYVWVTFALLQGLAWIGLVVPALGGGLAMALAWRSIKLGRETWLRDCAIVQAFLVICVATLTAIQAGTLSLTSTSYGVFFLFFGVLAFGPKMFAPAPGAKSARGGSASY